MKVVVIVGFFLSFAASAAPQIAIPGVSLETGPHRDIQSLPALSTAQEHGRNAQTGATVFMLSERLKVDLKEGLKSHL